ncbi:hypothetical protein [Eikenella corrodens]|uniref:Uncharacterized protein n=1 Tax=Eikenella corrodens TaxID=539 RepID=A0A3S9SJ78_EIKCO|nr:hypothetical protein [Eikenella corrodens]AZR59593.1 hypothetical protein ELB75_05880 [Eikenella corrodens]
MPRFTALQPMFSGSLCRISRSPGMEAPPPPAHYFSGSLPGTGRVRGTHASFAIPHPHAGLRRTPCRPPEFFR